MTPNPLDTLSDALEARMERDAARYRLLRRKFAIVGSADGAKFEAINLPNPTYIAPCAAAELDAVIDALIADSDPLPFTDDLEEGCVHEPVTRKEQ